MTNLFDQVIDRRKTDSLKWSRYPGDVLPLWVADMDFPAPPEAIQAIQERLAHPIFGYAVEDEELIDTIVQWLENRYGWQVQAEMIRLMPGVVTGLNWTAHALLDKGERYAIQTPVYGPFFDIADHVNVQRVEIPLTEKSNRYEIDFEAFEQQIRQDVRLFVLCNPHNPVGRAFTREELTTLGQICKAHGVLICSDEIHCDLVYPGRRHTPIASLDAEIAQRTITIMAPSKTFNIPGLHVSFAVIPDPDLRIKMDAGRSGLVGKPGILSCAAAKACYQHGTQWLNELTAYLERNRNMVFQFASEVLPGIRMNLPEATFLAWLDCRALNLETEPSEFFLKEARVAMNAGSWFGANGTGYVRLNFGCPQSVLEEALERMRLALKKTE